MSHRITTSTDIKDPDLAVSALNAAGWSHRVAGRSIHIQSGPMRNATINLDTGEVTGDTDYHNESDESLGALKQHYGEAKAKLDLPKNGYHVVSRTVDTNGDVVLRCRSFG
jgi:hypothetical protein